MMAAHNRDHIDEELRDFGGLYNQVCCLKNNDPEVQCFHLDGYYVEDYSHREWELLGGYIANNDYLRRMDIRTHRCLGDRQLSVLCRTMIGSRSLSTLRLGDDGLEIVAGLGLGGIQSLVPFLKNSLNLANLSIWNSPNVDSRCFELLARALDGRQIEELQLMNCNVDDIMPLRDCSLPRLMRLLMNENIIQLIPPLAKYTYLFHLDLSHNNIGKEGCRLLAKLLQNERSSLKHLQLKSNHIDDEAAEILANSIKHNTTLSALDLGENNFKEAGFRAFLKLLNDSSSIESTYNSNQTLQHLELPEDDDSWQTSSTISKYEKYIELALKINFGNRFNPQAIGKAKVVATQLNSTTRRELCLLQEIKYSLSNLLSDVEPALLPDLLALTGREHGQSELYLMLIASAPDLTSQIDKGSMLKELIARNTRQIVNLTSENLSLKQRLKAFTRAESIPKTVAKERTSTNGFGNDKKRRRADS